MRIRLIAPAIDKYLLARGHASKEARAFRFSILSLLAVAACTPPGHDVEIVDEHVERLDFDDPVDLVGVGFMTAHAPRAFAIGDEYRRRGIPVVFGGYHPSLLPDESLLHCDAVVVGEAEMHWSQLLADAATGSLARTYRSDTQLDLATLRPPRRTLVSRRDYFTVNAVQASRGCIHRCDFCSVHCFNRGTFRVRPVEHVLTEIAGLSGGYFIFIDDNLTADSEYAARLFRGLIALNKRWVAQASIQFARDPALIRLASAAGCIGVFIGIESLNASNLNEAGKAFNHPETYTQAIRELHRHRIGVQAGVVFGFDCDDVSVFDRTLAWLEATGVDALQASVLTPMPGTRLFNNLEHQGRIIDRDWQHYDFRHTVFQPARMSPRDLELGVDWITHSFYSLPRIARRASRGLSRGIGPLLTMWLPVNLAYRWDARRYTPSVRPRFLQSDHGDGQRRANGNAQE